MKKKISLAIVLVFIILPTLISYVPSTLSFIDNCFHISKGNLYDFCVSKFKDFELQELIIYPEDRSHCSIVLPTPILVSENQNDFKIEGLDKAQSDMIFEIFKLLEDTEVISSFKTEEMESDLSYFSDVPRTIVTFKLTGQKNNAGNIEATIKLTDKYGWFNLSHTPPKFDFKDFSTYRYPRLFYQLRNSSRYFKIQ